MSILPVTYSTKKVRHMWFHGTGLDSCDCGVWDYAFQLVNEQWQNGGQRSEHATNQCYRLAEYRLTEAAKGLNALFAWLYDAKKGWDWRGFSTSDLKCMVDYHKSRIAKITARLAIPSILLLGCSSKPAQTPEPESGGTCGPSSCPLPPDPPKGNQCHRAILNMTRMGMFYIAEVDPPDGPSQEALFCKLITKKGYSLACLEHAKTIMDVESCRPDQTPPTF